jgi:hypothetical protein
MQDSSQRKLKSKCLLINRFQEVATELAMNLHRRPDDRACSWIAS